MLGRYLEKVKKTAPLVHSITNYVTANDVANMILACGAKPVMADAPEEAAEITALAQGLNLNLGTPSGSRISAMLAAGKRANELGHAVLLDPVGVGASHFRKEAAALLLREIRFDVIRGNVSEVKALCGMEDGSGGVDALETDAVTEERLSEAVTFAKTAAERLGSILVVTGAVDLVTDGVNCYVIRGGRAEMSSVTGTGCQLSGLITAFLVANSTDRLAASVAAVCMMKIAGEIAWEHIRPEEGNATYGRRIIDAVYRMDGDTLERMADYEVR